MNHHLAWVASQEEHRARLARTEKYGAHYTERDRMRRSARRLWAFPRLRRRPAILPRPAVTGG